MVIENEGLTIEIRVLHGDIEAQKISEFMANSEPWATLKRTYEDSIRILSEVIKTGF